MITKEFLNTQANKIVERLNQLRIPTQINSGRTYPGSGFAEYVITPQYDRVRGKLPQVDQIINAQKDIANAIGNNEVRIYQNIAAEICVEVHIENPDPPTMEELASQATSSYQLILGRDRVGNALFFDLKDPACAHLLIAGTTGSGKTALAHSIILNAVAMHTPEQLKLAIIDYNNTEADWFFPKIKSHTRSIPTNLGEAENLLKQIASKMFDGKLSYKLLIFVDELAGLCAESKEALKAIEVITQQGRKYGVHLISATQKPAASAIGSLLKSNMRRVVGKVASPEDSKVATGMPGVGCESLAGNGQFIFVNGELERFQSALPEGYGIVRRPEPSLATGDILDFELDPEVLSDPEGITKEAAQQAIERLKAKNAKLSKSSVLREMGYNNAGGANRAINTLWESLIK